MVFFIVPGEAQLEYYRQRRLQREESRRAERKAAKPEDAARASTPKQGAPAGTSGGSAAGEEQRRPPRLWPLRVLSLAAGVMLACSTAEAVPCLLGYCGYFYAKNECSDPVRLAIYYDEWWGDWTFEGFYRLRPGQTRLLDAVVPKTLFGEDDFGRPVSKRIAVRVPLRTGTATFYYYAETTDGRRRVWDGHGERGGKWVTVDSASGRKLLFRKRTDRWNDVHLTLACGKPGKRRHGAGTGGAPHGVDRRF